MFDIRYGNTSIMKQSPSTPLSFGLQPPFLPPLVHCCSSSLTPPSTFHSLLLTNLVRGKSHFEATTKSRQRRDPGPNCFQLLLQFHPKPILKLGPRLALGEPRRGRDLAVRHVLAVRFRSHAGAVHERARTNLGLAGQHPDKNTDGEVVVVAVKFAVAEAGRSEEGLATHRVATNYVRTVFQD